jgi:hypothetical protein
MLVQGKSGPAIPTPDGGIKVEASMCYLRGVLMTRLNRQDRAKEHFMEALALDVKCYDAFHELISGNLLGINEGALRKHFFDGKIDRLRRMGLRARTPIQPANSRRC